MSEVDRPQKRTPRRRWKDIMKDALKVRGQTCMRVQSGLGIEQTGATWYTGNDMP